MSSIREYRRRTCTTRARQQNASTSYQLTIAALFDEIVVGGSLNFGVATAILQPLTGGQVSLFYDTIGTAGSGTLISTADVALGTGTGYTDGLLIASGKVDTSLSPATSVSANGTSATGSANVAGLLTYVAAGSNNPDTVGFDPAPHDFESTTTLQYGPNTKGYQVSNFFDNANGWTSVGVREGVDQAPTPMSTSRPYRSLPAWR